MSRRSWSNTVFAALAALAATLAAPAGAQLLFDARLNGLSETPPVGTDAYGHCTGILKGFDFADPEAGDPVFEIACTHNVADATVAHIHPGFPGEPGPPLFDLDDPASIAETWDLSVEEAIRLIAGGYYVNVHSPAHPPGEIRGQLLLDQPVEEGVEITGFPLSGEQETPPVETAADGACFAVLDLDPTVVGTEQGTLDLFCSHSVVDPTLAHIHLADRGVPGGIVVPLGSPVSPIIVHDIDLDSDLADSLRAGDLYVNVHSDAHSAGEIRGQMDYCTASTERLCLQEGRFTVEVDFATTQGGGAGGPAIPVRLTDDSGVFWFFDPANLELLVKVLDACATNGRYWVFFAGTTNVGFTLTVTDERTGDSKTYSSPDLTETDPILDADAFETCS